MSVLWKWATTKYVSWSWKSSGGEATMIPVIPPSRNRYRKPIAHSIGVSNVRWPRHIVAIQLKNFTPVGTAIANEARLKNGPLTAPVVNMWWAQTDIDRLAIAIVARTNAPYPNTGFRLKTEMISVITPKNGRIRMYTSGWPKNQKRCCQRIAEPPWPDSKIAPPRWRSMNSIARAAVSGGNANRINSPVTRMFQVKIGIRK